MASRNRAVVFMGPKKLELRDYDYPEMVDPKGRTINHAVIVKLVVTNICGSDQHIYRGRFPAPSGMKLGHENTGEVVEVGPAVEFIKKGDLVSIPFNVSCGKCRNCKERHTDTCMNANDEADCAAYGFNLGGWDGGQADYMLVPWADWNLLKFPDKQQAMEKIKDLTLLLLLGIVLVYMVMAAQFESLLDPFIIMFSIKNFSKRFNRICNRNIRSFCASKLFCYKKWLT